MRYLSTTICIAVAFLSSHVVAQGTLEIPQPDSTQSGISIVSGWHCDAGVVEVAFDGDPPIAVAYGTTRADTESVCGDDNNGFSLLWAYGLLGSGQHEVVAYADGEEFGRAAFTVTDIADGDFLKGARGRTRIKGFPDVNSDLVLEWQEANQNFVISSQEPSADSYNAVGLWEASPGTVMSVHIGEPLDGMAHAVVIITTASGSYEFYAGQSSGSVLDVNHTTSNIIGKTSEQLTIQLLSSDDATVTTNNCTPASACFGPPGAILNFKKVL